MIVLDICTFVCFIINEALDVFKVFKVEVDKHCDKQIKVVKTNRGGEYYRSGQAPGPFAKSLQEHGIVG